MKRKRRKKKKKKRKKKATKEGKKKKKIRVLRPKKRYKAPESYRRGRRGKTPPLYSYQVSQVILLVLTTAMPRRKKNSQPSQPESDESDEGYCPTQTELTQVEDLSNTEKRALLGQVCNLLLAGEIKKVPVKKAFIKKHIFKKHKKHFEDVMEGAKNSMRHVFGYEIVTLKDSYILVNNLKSKLVKLQDLSEAEFTVKGLLTTMLMVIFMSEGKISAGSLEISLNILDIEMTTTAKPTIQGFVRKKYLEIETESSSDPPTVMYKWGERAHAEFSKKQMLDLVCKIYGNNMKPQEWTQQWNLIQEEPSDEDED